MSSVDTVILFAVEREVTPFLRLFANCRAIGPARWSCANGRVLVEMLGVGREGARKKADDLLSNDCRPQRLIVAGFAGALRANLVVGEVLIPSEIVDEASGRWLTGWPAVRAGRLVTSDRMIGKPAEKFALGLKHAADMVDMESAAVAEVCVKHGIPFGCIRVISDDVTRPLSPQLMNLVESGRVSTWRLTTFLLRSPPRIIELLRLARHTKHAAKRLAQELHRLLQDRNTPNGEK